MASINSIGNTSNPIISTMLTTTTTAANTTSVRAYNTNTLTYTGFIIATAGNPATCDLDDSVTKAGQYIYRAGGNKVAVTDGGTGVGTLTSHGLIYGNGVGNVGVLAEASNGQIPVGSTGNPPVLATITAGTGVTVTNGAGTISIASSGGGLTWTEVTGTSASLAINNGYIANNAGIVTLTLPTTAVIGSIIKIVGKGAGLWRLAQNASQFINIVNTTTTTGAGGSLTATEQFDCLTVICTTANNGWVADIVTGNLTIV